MLAHGHGGQLLALDLDRLPRHQNKQHARRLLRAVVPRMDRAPLHHDVALLDDLLRPAVQPDDDLPLQHDAEVQAHGPMHGRHRAGREVDGAHRRAHRVAQRDGLAVGLGPGPLDGGGEAGRAEDVDEADVLGRVRGRGEVGGRGEGVVGRVGVDPVVGGEGAVVVEDGGAGGGVAGYDAADGGEGGAGHFVGVCVYIYVFLYLYLGGGNVGVGGIRVAGVYTQHVFGDLL